MSKHHPIARIAATVVTAAILTAVSGVPSALAYGPISNAKLVSTCTNAVQTAGVQQAPSTSVCTVTATDENGNPLKTNGLAITTTGMAPLDTPPDETDGDGQAVVTVTLPTCTAADQSIWGTVLFTVGNLQTQRTQTMTCTPVAVTVNALRPTCAFSRDLPDLAGQSEGQEQICSFSAGPAGVYNVSYAITPTGAGASPTVVHGDAVTDANGTFSATVDSYNGDAYTLTGTVTDNRNVAGSSKTVSSSVPPAVHLGRASGFSVLAATGVTDNGNSFYSDDIGIANGPITGVATSQLFGAQHVTDDAAGLAQDDLASGFDRAYGRTPADSFTGDNNGKTFGPGVHATAAAFGLTGTMYLDGQNNPDSNFVFQVGGALGTGAGSRIALVNGAQASRVFFLTIGAASLGADSIFQGTVLARGAITAGAGATVHGSLLSQGAVTLATNDINGNSAANLGPVNLRSASTYAVLANTALTDNDNSFIGGDVGLRPTGTVVGVLATQVSGTVNQQLLSSTQARADFTHAYSAIRAMVPTDTFAGDQNGKTFGPGVHAINAAFSLTGTMYLDAGNTPDADFVFQVAGALSTGASSRIALVNGAQASHVFFEVIGAGTPGADSVFQGTLMTSGAITVGAGATVNGAVLSKTAITIATNDINRGSGTNPVWGPNWSPKLGAAASYVALCATGLTDNGMSSFVGNVGVGVGSITTGLSAKQVAGTVYVGDPLVTQARQDFTRADSAIRALAPTDTFAGDQIGNTFGPGVHATGGAFALTGKMYLDAHNDPNANFVFQITGALGTAAGSEMILTNGAQASHVFFQVTGDAGSGAGAKLVGTIMTSGAITLGIGSVIDGALMSKTAITLATNTVSWTNR